MKEETQYCVVATRRSDEKRNRIMLTKGMSKDRADLESQRMQTDRTDKSLFKYFKVAKYPFKEK